MDGCHDNRLFLFLKNLKESLFLNKLITIKIKK